MARRATRGRALQAHVDGRVALMWRGHMAGPREPTPTLGWGLHGMNSDRLASDGPTSIVGLG